MVKTFKKICAYSIFSLFMIVVVKWWLNDFKKPEEVESVMSFLLELENEGVEGVKKILGEPKSIHRGKVYTYKDSLGTYDILIDEKVKSIVVSLNDKIEMSEQQVISELGLREDIVDKSVSEKEGVKKIVIYDVGKISKLEMSSELEDKGVDIVKIAY